MLNAYQTSVSCHFSATYTIAIYFLINQQIFFLCYFFLSFIPLFLEGIVGPHLVVLRDYLTAHRDFS